MAQMQQSSVSFSSLKVSNRDPVTASPIARRTLLTDDSFNFEGIPLTCTSGTVYSNQGLGTENDSGVAGEGEFITHDDFNPVSEDFLVATTCIKIYMYYYKIRDDSTSR